MKISQSNNLGDMIQMKRLLIALTLFCSGVSYAGVISRTNYTDGQTITAALQNSNENTIVTEINGNLDVNNIADSAITGAKILDGTIMNVDINASAAIAFTKLDAPTQSSSTYVFSTLQTMATYRRPNLTWIGNATVDIENNTGTSNETCLFFPDERRCVTEDTSSTSVSRRAITTETASLSGTKNSGLQPGFVLQTNAYYATYGVKASDASSYVVVFTTTQPSQANYATLNTDFGTNGWVYLGTVRIGNNRNNSNHLLKFVQTANYTVIASSVTSNPLMLGVELSSAAATITYAVVNGFAGNTIPAHFKMYRVSFSGLVAAGNTVGALAGDITNGAYETSCPSIDTVMSCVVLVPSNFPQLRISLSGSPTNGFVILSGWIDGALAGPLASPF